MFPSDEKTTVQVFYMEEAEAFVMASTGHLTLTNLEDIEGELPEYGKDLFKHGDGEYVFSVSYEPAQTGEYGMIEIASYWELDFLNYRPLIGKEEG